MIRYIRFLLALAAMAGPVRAEFDDPFVVAPGAVKTAATLVAESSAIAPGKAFTLALRLEHPAGWHSYYRNSGGIELPPAIEWHLPAGFSAGPIQWPTPSLKDGYSGKSFIYTGTPVLLVELKAPADLPTGGKVTVGAKASWQMCSDTCMNEEKTFSLSLMVGSAVVADPAQAELFAQARSKIPGPNAKWDV
ncbi:MAG: protein-disulfide reductase DsbD domain-containing protein, partial [Verrucomicrobiota bacterium]